jgi:hypothetical protein
MRQRRTAEEPPPPRTDRPLRQVVLYLTITYGLALAIALALPRADIAPRISIVVPVIAVALTVAFAVPRDQRRAVWATVGFNPRRGRGLLIAVVGPAAVIAASFSIAAALGVVRFPGLAPGFGSGVLSIAVTTIIFTVVLLGEEIGWRGYLLLRLAELTGIRDDGDRGRDHDHHGAASGYLLTRRAADFVKAEPKSPQPITRSRAAA